MATLEPETVTILKMLDKRFKANRNRLIENKRIIRELGLKPGLVTSKRIRKMLIHLNQMDIINPYYEEESVEIARVWMVSIEKVEEYLEEASVDE